MPAAPAALTGNLLGRLNALSDSCDYDMVAVDRVEFAARGLPKNGKDYHVIMGICASLKADVEAVKGHFAKAFAAAPMDPDVYNNASVSLRELGFIDEAIDVYKSAPLQMWNNPDFLRQAFDEYAKYGFVERARGLSEQFEKLNLEDPSGGIAGIEKFLQHKGMSEQNVYEAVKAALQFMCAKGKRRFSVFTRLVGSNDENRRLVYRLSYPSDAASAFAMESELLDALDQTQLPAITTDALSFYIMPSAGGGRGDIAS